ncbi:MAG: hypothetical protein GF401_11725 [Chitinivibrionales bacterium]|nr:hypothetical protein [Chitinivibrionales bacterium]
MNHRTYTIIILVLAGVTLSQANWNLPYSRPAAYDYSLYYSPELNDHLDGNPDFFKSEIAKGWTYYKSTFLMSNGLVNHQRLENNSLTGQNEAVSEGQGYGMILALLNNDQETFNTIFEAANTHMWNDSRQSYFIWNYPAGAQGAATDADLDIGIALVFADELQKKGLWESYSKNSVTYGSRALEIIKSIKANMTQDDYLLPGDNWGGDGTNNLNPSYFATAWLKVFNAYQNEVDFTPVIDKCYQVLNKMPRYDYGQAANWITPSGGNASFGDRSMGPDAIRTPWRIAMDALWFNDPRAIAYCKNSKGTLTEYNNTTSINYMIAQMALYTESGQAVLESKGLCDNVAMWSCAILGSKDIGYSSKGLHPKVMGKIVGTSRDFFGSSSLQDEKYYYKQSLALLGFAAVGGQFPNIYADMQGSIEPPEPVTLVSALSANTTEATFPGTVTFSAELDKAASWSIELTSQTSGKTETFSGNDMTISAQWDGAGFYTKESVVAALSVVGLDETTPADNLNTTVTIVTPHEKPSVEPGATLMVHDLENGSTVSEWNGAWYLFDDKSTDGTSTTNPVDAIDLVQPNVGNPGYGIQIQFTVDQYAGVGLNVTKEGETLDFSNVESITFDYKTEGINNVLFMLATSNISNYAYNLTSLSGSSSWKTQAVLLSALQPPPWSPSTTMDPHVTEKFQWQVETGNSGTLWLDNVEVKFKSAEVPGDDIMALYGPSPVNQPHPKSSYHTDFAVKNTGKRLLIHTPHYTNAAIIEAGLFTVQGRLLQKYRFRSPKPEYSIPLNRFAEGLDFAIISVKVFDNTGNCLGSHAATQIAW